MEDSEDSCFFWSLNTCSRTALVPNQTLYVSVYCYQGCNYTINAEVAEVQPAELGHEYEVDFGDVSSGVVSFTVDDSYDQVLILAEYVNFYTAGKYEMVLSEGKIPSDGNYERSAQQLGAFRKAIKLNSDYLEPNATYYLLLSGEPTVTLRLSITGLNSDALTIPLNNSVFDLVTQNSTYSISYPYSPTTYTDALIIRLRQASGYGVILVNYCGDMNFSFIDMSGENGELMVTPD